MNIRKVFFAVTGVLLGYWFLSSVIQLHYLVQKYPMAFQKLDGYSFFQFYNTYQTLSTSDFLIRRGSLGSVCDYPGFKDDEEKERLLPIIREENLRVMGFSPDDTYQDHIKKFASLDVNCVADSKLIAFDFKCKEAYATFSCESGDYRSEFTFSSSDLGKCYAIDSKKSWGIEPTRTIEDTKDMITDAPKFIFDSPNCSLMGY